MFAEDAAAVGEFYARLDRLQESAAAELAVLLRDSEGLSPQSLVEREAHVARLRRRLAQLRAAERRLVFGRLDLDDGSSVYVGRLGLRPDGRVLVDWRAPAAAAFYQATPASPGPVVRRRHLHLEGRRLVEVSDDLLTRYDGEAPTGGPGSQDALARVLAAPRTGHMRDIVTTLQAEQDRIIRTPGRGALVVDGAPGTGKTVVALHRAAYLLYSEPARRAGGILVVGPTAAFLHYIEHVLPALGETDVVLAQPADLYPLTEPALGSEDPAVARLKGSLAMAEVLRRAVRNRQRLLPAPVPLLVDDVEVLLRPDVVRRARDAARASGEAHNQAREAYVEVVLADLLGQFLAAEADGAEDANGADPVDSADADDNDRDRDRVHEPAGAIPASRAGDSPRAQALAALHRSADVRREVNLRWMPLTPEKVLRDLFADQSRLRDAAPGWSAADRARLLRRRDAAWTTADVPLLDELAALLGTPPPSTAERAAAATDADTRREAVRFASDTLTSYGLGETLTADELARRFGVDGHEDDLRPLADRAAADPSWAYGHVIVDEAQDLTPMQWRMVMRRSPSKSMTIVGDLNQRSHIAPPTGPDARPDTCPEARQPRTWAGVLGPHLRHWRQETLTVNYRTPGEHLQLARRLLHEAGVAIPEVESARWGGTVTEVDTSDADLPPLVTEELATCHGVLALVTADLTGLSGLEHRLPVAVTVTTPVQAKGLEFDTVIVLDPHGIAARLGPGDLYVSLTRATHRLVLARRRPPTS